MKDTKADGESPPTTHGEQTTLILQRKSRNRSNMILPHTVHTFGKFQEPLKTI